MPPLPKNFRRLSRPTPKTTPLPVSPLPPVRPAALVRTPSVASVTLLAWTNREVKITLLDEVGGPYFVKKVAVVLGQIAVFPMRSDEAGTIRWSVTLLTVGLRVVQLASEAEARRMAEYLWATFRPALMMETVEGVRAKLPSWAKDWLAACGTVGKFVAPGEDQR